MTSSGLCQPCAAGKYSTASGLLHFIVNARLEPILSNKQACNGSLIAKGVLVQLEKLTTAGSRRLAECGFALAQGPEIERAHDLSVRQDYLSTAST